MAITTVLRLDMKALRQMMAEVLSLPSDRVIDGNEEVDVSKMSHFITVLPIIQDDLGTEIIFDGKAEVEKINNLSEMTVSVNAYGRGANEILNKLVMSMRSDFVYRSLRGIGVGYLKASQIRNLPTAISGGKEQRSQVDLIFSINNRLIAEVKRGDNVEISIEGN